MATPVKIKVLLDDDGKLTPATNARVTFGRRDLLGDSGPLDNFLPSHLHSGEGNYTVFTGDPNDEPGEGEWLLVVRGDGRGPVVQHLTFKAVGGKIRADPGWSGRGRAQDRTAATVSIVNFGEAKGADTAADQTLITVRLLPTSFVVLLSCVEHLGLQTRWVRFADGRRDFMFDNDKIDEGVVVFLLNAEDNERSIQVKSQNKSAKSWVTLERKPLGRKIGILDFYAEVDAVGKRHPGTLVEASILGHGWLEGPIVQSTFDSSPSFVDRDPDDLDGRHKDWADGGVIETRFPDFDKAFRADNLGFRLWGCSHMDNVILEATQARTRLTQNRPRDEFFRVNWVGGTLNTTLDFTKRSFGFYALSTAVGHMQEHGNANGKATYLGMASRKLNTRVFGAPMGMGSNLGKRGGHFIMHMTETGENERITKYYKAEFAAVFVRNDFKYLDYKTFRTASLPDPGWSPLRFARYHDDSIDRTILRLPSHFEVHGELRAVEYKDPVAFTFESVAGQLYVASKSRVGRLEQRTQERVMELLDDDEHDLGFFVDTAGRLLLLQRDHPSGAWARSTETLQVVTMRRIHRGRWQPDTSTTPTPVVEAIIEQVTPRWFW